MTAADDALVERLDGLLPQTQCRLCGQPGCRPYAQALARGEVGADRCPPGGDATARALADALGLPHSPRVPPRPDTVAVIDPGTCIGCAKCLGACPVDAIVGAPGVLHAVLTAECTGCNLCLPPCPVDCIAVVPAGAPLPMDDAARRRRAARYRVHLDRQAAPRPVRSQADGAGDTDRRRAYVEAAIRRVRARRSAAPGDGADH